MFGTVIAYIRGIVGRRRVADEVDEELAFHLEHEIAENIRRGLSPVEARRIALASLGGMDQTRESVRDVRLLSIDALWRDVKHALRSLRATPAFTVVALAVLTLSIGASTAIFSVVDGVVLRGLPYPQSERLVEVGDVNLATNTAQSENLAAAQNFLDWDAQQTVFSDLAAIGYAGVSLRAEPGQDPEMIEAQSVTFDFFKVLGVPLLFGPGFTPENEKNSPAARAVVISYSLWQRRFGGALDVIGRPLPGILGDFEIVGVTPASFAYPAGAPRPTEAWLPLVIQDQERVRENSFGYRLQVIGRLRSGVSIAQAQAQMNEIFARLAAETPRWFEHRAFKVEALQEYLTRGVRRWMAMLLAAVACVLLIACVNLANLMLVRASARGRELTIRSALGASRWDLARALMVESLLLSLTGAAFGAALAWLGVDALRAAIPAEVPRIASIAVDLRILAVTTAAAVATGLIFGAAPLSQLSRFAADRGIIRITRGTASPAHHWLRTTFLVAEVALAVVLLIGSGLFLASFARVSSVNLGLDPHSVLSVRVRPLSGAHNWEMSQQRNRGLLRTILEQAGTLPGVEGAALHGGGAPLTGNLRTFDLAIPGRQLPPDEDLDYNEVSAAYFRVMRIPLLAGRAFEDSDRDGSEPVVIINEAAAQRYFPGENPVGQMVQFAGLRRVVGVVGSIRHNGPETNWRRQGYIPFDQTRAVGGTLMLRLSSDPGHVLAAVKTIVWSQFPGIPMPESRMLSSYISDMIAPRRFNMLLLNLFGLIGVVIACVGIYGVMAYTVALRTNEIGIRMALGAVPSVILRSVLGRAVLYLSGGLALGLFCAWFLGSLVSGFLFQVEPHDLSVYASVSAVLIATGLLAAFIPARRASHVDPLIALRLE